MARETEDAQAAEIDAIFARLQEEIRNTPAVGSHGREVHAWLAAREDAEQRWAVTADRPFVSRPGSLGRLRGLVLVPVKSVVRKLVRWYVEPFAADQRSFNAVALRLLDDLHERTASLVARLERASEELRVATRRLAELDDRVLRLERRDGATSPLPPSPAGAVPDTGGAFDHFALEVRLRGPSTDVRARQAVYVDDLRGAAPVLDVGCGRGEMLVLLRDAGIAASGVDADPDMVAFAQAQHLDVVQADALQRLDTLRDGSLGGVFAAQFVEHLPPARLIRFIELAAHKLRPGGVLVLETINPLSFVALRHFFADLTHCRPLVPETLEIIARHAGFARTEVRFVNEPPASERLWPVALPDAPDMDDAREALDANVRRLNEIVFGPQDYALIARR